MNGGNQDIRVDSDNLQTEIVEKNLQIETEQDSWNALVLKDRTSREVTRIPQGEDRQKL